MSDHLSPAEFKRRLADADARQELGLGLSDQEALRIVVDEQRVADLYVEWRTGAVASTPPPAPTEQTTASSPTLWRQPLTWVLAGAGIVAVVARAPTLTLPPAPVLVNPPRS